MSFIWDKKAWNQYWSLLCEGGNYRNRPELFYSNKGTLLFSVLFRRVLWFTRMTASNVGLNYIFYNMSLEMKWWRSTLKVRKTKNLSFIICFSFLWLLKVLVQISALLLRYYSTMFQRVYAKRIFRYLHRTLDIQPYITKNLRTC